MLMGLSFRIGLRRLGHYYLQCGGPRCYFIEVYKVMSGIDRANAVFYPGLR